MARTQRRRRGIGIGSTLFVSTSDEPAVAVVAGVFADRDTAQSCVRRLVDDDFPMDQISVLGHAASSGDDVLGIYYHGIGDRMKAWSAHGAFWGGLWGLLSGAAGVFVVPGLGWIAAAGPVVEVLANALAGAAVAGGTMAGAGALSEVAVAFHRMGVPEGELQRLHEAIEQGRFVVLLRCAAADAERWQSRLSWLGASEASHYRYYP